MLPCGGRRPQFHTFPQRSPLLLLVVAFGFVLFVHWKLLIFWSTFNWSDWFRGWPPPKKPSRRRREGKPLPDNRELAENSATNLRRRSTCQGRSSHRVQMEFPELRKRYWGRHFWARGYFCTTSGNITDEAILQYLKYQ